MNRGGTSFEVPSTPNKSRRITNQPQTGIDSTLRAGPQERDYFAAMRFPLQMPAAAQTKAALSMPRLPAGMNRY